MAEKSLTLLTAFISGCAEFFYLPFPGIGLPIWQVLGTFIAADVVLNTVGIVFGVHNDGSSEVLNKYKRD